MTCAWDCFINILPLWIRSDVDKLGRDALQELRLRSGMNPVLKMKEKSIQLDRKVTAEDLHYCVNTASRYSPWVAKTAGSGYITAPGGHRIGICGDATGSTGSLTDVSGITSLCLRVARDFPGIAQKLDATTGSALIIGRPGSGKTTLLRDLIRFRSSKRGESISVVDERGELFPRSNRSFCFPTGSNTDVLSGCSKVKGIQMVLRSMNPDVIAIDEITAEEDCDALIRSAWCGVCLLATAHAGSKEDLLRRPVYRPIVESHLFETLIVMKKDMSFHAERLYV